MTARAFAVRVEARGTVHHVTIEGELDIATAAQLEAALPVGLGPGDTLLVDLRELDFMDSSGIHVLMRLDVESRADGWTLVLVRGRPDVQRLLDLCHVGERIREVDDPAQLPAG